MIKSPLNEEDKTKKSEMILNNTKKLDVECFIEPNYITSGNNKLNNLFTVKFSINILEAIEKEKIKAVKLI